LLRCFSRSRRFRSAAVNATDRRFFTIDDDMLFQASLFANRANWSLVGCSIDHESRSCRLPPHSLFHKACLALIDRPA
jgi:hypothetical protein